MPLGLLGNKIGMTQIFDKNNNIIPITVLKVGPCIVTQINTIINNDYNAIQLGYGLVKNKQLTKPELGHLQKLNLPSLKYLKEFYVPNPEKFKIGETLSIKIFSDSKFINIQGKSSGKGFSGSHKRHNFARGPMSHGSKNHRKPGSIGMGTDPGRVFPGKKMPGQLGNKMTSIKKLKVIQIDLEENILIVRGSVPGKPGNLLIITLTK